MTEIIPSILENSIEAYQDKLEEVLKIPDVETIQVDFSDGVFTSNKTISVSDIDLLNPAYKWEAHLMVVDPKKYFFDAKLAGFNTIIFHFEAVEDKNQLKPMAEELAGYKISAGLALNPETEIAATAPYLQYFQQILLMGVHPGYQGAEMLPETAERLKELKKYSKNAKIEIDGGIKLSNVRELSANGADICVVGSALFDKGSGNDEEPVSPAENFQKFIEEMQKV